MESIFSFHTTELHFSVHVDLAMHPLLTQKLNYECSGSLNLYMAQPTQLSDTATNHLKRNLCYSVKKKNFSLRTHREVNF